MTDRPSDDIKSNLDCLLVFETLEDMIYRAKRGDTSAAQMVLASIAHYLHPSSAVDIPKVVREYLSEAFYKMSNGEKPQNALNLSRSGRPNYSRKLKITVAYLVYQLINKEKLCVIDAAEQAAELINSELHDGRFYELENRPISSDTTRNWYTEFKGDIDTFARIARNTEKP